MRESNLWQRYALLLDQVEKPSRYLGQEWGSVTPAEKEGADYHAVLAYPDTYEIGQANQAIAILYDCLNANEHIYCERAYLPWVDMIALMRGNGLPLASLETYTPVREFDFVGITLPHELCATNVLEFLDLAGIPLHTDQRGDDDPLVCAGGPCAYNPEPFAPFFDVIFVGEGEELDVEAALRHRELKAQGASRAQILRELACIEGVYVPSLYEVTEQEIRDERLAPGARGYTTVTPRDADVPARVEKRIIRDFDALPALPRQIVPYCELVHDRLAIEILRGCNRGCRFCQAGMIYRPVRERNADTVIAAVMDGLVATGYDEVSLTSLSSTDHSTIEQMLRRLNRSFSGTGKSVSLPSQRVDALGVELARLAAGEKKGSLTLAPEAGTQRLRDCINKGVSEDDLLRAVTGAVEAGRRGFKLYFMIGLPGETDEDVAGIGALCRRVYAAAKDAVPEGEPRNIRLNVSVALFIPKAMTPFQWDRQISLPEISHRIEVLRASFPKKGINLHWHDSDTSYVEAVLARGGRECAELVEEAWRRGARFDAWTEQFTFAAWEQAGDVCGIPIMQRATCEYEEGAPLPWSHISAGVSEEFLRAERARAGAGEKTPDCSFTSCSQCGVCPLFGMANVLEATRVLRGERA
ncbi:MAG: TIGR03960 family B12-binding radical SAM protein [Coriobacteriales bacterium]